MSKRVANVRERIQKWQPSNAEQARRLRAFAVRYVPDKIGKRKKDRGERLYSSR